MNTSNSKGGDLFGWCCLFGISLTFFLICVAGLVLVIIDKETEAASWVVAFVMPLSTTLTIFSLKKIIKH